MSMSSRAQELLRRVDDMQAMVRVDNGLSGRVAGPCRPWHDALTGFKTVSVTPVNMAVLIYA